MTRRSILIAAAVGIVLIGAGGWYWWSSRRVSLYGGSKAYMQKLQTLYEATSTELSRSDPLPLDFVQMEQLAQTAQDIFAVYAENALAKDARFARSATELMRQGSKLEHAWDSGLTSDATTAFAELTHACNDCHENHVQTKPAQLIFAPPDRQVSRAN